MVRNLELWQGERERERRGATRTGRRAQEIAAVAGRSQFANIFISIARCATGCQDKLGLFCLCLCPWPLATCVSGICVCAAAIDTGHTRTGKARASDLCQRDAAQTKRHLVAWSMLKSLGCRLTCSACSGLGISVGSRVAWLWCLGLGLRLGLIH